jgi:hypothetical protein
MRKGKPKVYAGSAVGVRLPGLMEIKIRVAAQEKGVTVSDIIRESLERDFGAGEAERSPK